MVKVYFYLYYVDQINYASFGLWWFHCEKKNNVTINLNTDNKMETQEDFILIHYS